MDHRRDLLARELKNTKVDAYRIRHAHTIFICLDCEDHLVQLGQPHVDTLRTVLDWIDEQNAHFHVLVGVAGKQNMRLVLQEFGFDHLTKEYDRLSFLDTNLYTKPTADFSILIHGLETHRVREDRWEQATAPRRRVYTPKGHVWQSEKHICPDKPDLIIVDGMHVRHTHLDGRMEAIPLEKFFVGTDATVINNQIHAILTPTYV